MPATSEGEQRFLRAVSKDASLNEVFLIEWREGTWIKWSVSPAESGRNRLHSSMSLLSLMKCLSMQPA